MPSVNLRELRNTRQIKAWLKAGETIEVRERNSVLGELTPKRQPSPPVTWPDAAARRRRIFGESVIPAVEILIEERENSRY